MLRAKAGYERAREHVSPRAFGTCVSLKEKGLSETRGMIGPLTSCDQPKAECRTSRKNAT